MKNIPAKRHRSDKHYGEIVEVAIRRSNISISEICNRLGVSRRSMYNWFDRDNLEAHIIKQIAQILNHDFSEELPELELDGQTINPREQRTENAAFNYPDSVSYWKEKYLNLLKRHHSLLISV